MAQYSGFVGSLIKGSSTGGEFAVLEGVSTTTIISESVPRKILTNALIAVHTQGVSGTYSIEVVGAIGGATYVIAGVTGIAADGTAILGASGTALTLARPTALTFASAEDGSGFTASVFIAGEY